MVAVMGSLMVSEEYVSWCDVLTVSSDHVLSVLLYAVSWCGRSSNANASYHVWFVEVCQLEMYIAKYTARSVETLLPSRLDQAPMQPYHARLVV